MAFLVGNIIFLWNNVFGTLFATVVGAVGVVDVVLSVYKKLFNAFTLCHISRSSAVRYEYSVWKMFFFCKIF